jgi:hypothetical protein
MKREIIQKLKENTSAFGLMSLELQEAAKELNKKEFVYFSATGEGCWCQYSNDDFCPDVTYRLRSDYQPEPELERAEITEQREDSILPHYGFVYQGEWVTVSCTPDLVNFSHFETDKGEKIYLEDVATYIRLGGIVFVVMRKGL